MKKYCHEIFCVPAKIAKGRKNAAAVAIASFCPTSKFYCKNVAMPGSIAIDIYRRTVLQIICNSERHIYTCR